MPQPRKPARLRAIDGAQPTAAPVLPSIHDDPGPAPAYLPAEARREYERIVDVLSQYPRWLSTVDIGALESYCMQWWLHRRAARDVAKRGPLVPGRSSADAARSDDGMVRNPSVAQMRDAADLMRRLAATLGLTPVSRDRLSVADDQANGPGPWDLLTQAEP